MFRLSMKKKCRKIIRIEKVFKAFGDNIFENVFVYSRYGAYFTLPKVKIKNVGKNMPSNM